MYEPQLNMYNLLVRNINQNNLKNKIIPNNLGVFCFEGKGKMNNIDLDGGGGVVSKRYHEESHLNCNFGGIGLGSDGEEISLTTIDNMKLDDIGYIHCDAQGSENFIFSKGLETIKNVDLLYSMKIMKCMGNIFMIMYATHIRNIKKKAYSILKNIAWKN